MDPQSSAPRLRGRPRKSINRDVLRALLADDMTITNSKIARILKVNRRTVIRRIKEYQLKRKEHLTAEELHSLVVKFNAERPKSGYRYLQGRIANGQKRASRNRIREALRRVAGVGVFLRRREKIKRRAYKVARPNALWHLDGHHKLIEYGIVVHGFIDGFSRMVRGKSLYSHPSI